MRAARAPIVACLAAALLAAIPSRAMEIQRFEQMADDDQYRYLGDLVWGAMRVLEADGKAGQAAKVREMFVPASVADDPAATDATMNLGKTLMQASALDAEIAANDAKAPRLEVEDVMRVFLLSQDIDLPAAFMTVASAFEPKLPPVGKRGDDQTGFGTPGPPQQFLTVQALQVALTQRAKDERSAPPEPTAPPIERTTRSSAQTAPPAARSAPADGRTPAPDERTDRGPTETISPVVDCDTARSACDATCSAATIRDRDRGADLPQTDFSTWCERSCAAGFDACRVQDSINGCATFVNHCGSACPWSVTDTTTGATLRHTDSFAQCTTACDSGFGDCREAHAKVPPRPRTETFDRCEEAQYACYTRCMAKPAAHPTSFPDQCAEACSKGVAACNGPSAAEKCADFEHGCAVACPSAITDQNGQSVDFDGRGECAAACKGAAEYCRAIAGG